MTKRAWFWALLPVAMLVATALSMLVVISMALGDPGFSVEKNYYNKAVDYDRVLNQQKHSAELGWQMTAEVQSYGPKALVIAHLSDRASRPISGATLTAEAFALARAQRPDELDFSETEPGSYQAQLSRHRAGLWELRFTAELGTERFTKVLRTDALSVPSQRPSTGLPSAAGSSGAPASGAPVTVTADHPRETHP